MAPVRRGPGGRKSARATSHTAASETLRLSAQSKAHSCLQSGQRTPRSDLSQHAPHSLCTPTPSPAPPSTARWLPGREQHTHIRQARDPVFPSPLRANPVAVLSPPPPGHHPRRTRRRASFSPTQACAHTPPAPHHRWGRQTWGGGGCANAQWDPEPRSLPPRAARAMPCP